MVAEKVLHIVGWANMWPSLAIMGLRYKLHGTKTGIFYTFLAHLVEYEYLTEDMS